jgi:hypothetical protein
MNGTLTISGCEVWQGVVALLLLHEVLEHGQVVVEGSDVQHANDDVSKVVRVKHLKNMLNTVLWASFIGPIRDYSISPIV